MIDIVCTLIQKSMGIHSSNNFKHFFLSFFFRMRNASDNAKVVMKKQI